MTMGTATIQAFDDPDGTIYLLRRDGHADVLAEVPQPLLQLAPDAIRLPSVTGADRLSGRVVHMADNSCYVRKGKP